VTWKNLLARNSGFKNFGGALTRGEERDTKMGKRFIPMAKKKEGGVERERNYFDKENRGGNGRGGKGYSRGGGGKTLHQEEERKMLQ